VSEAGVVALFFSHVTNAWGQPREIDGAWEGCSGDYHASTCVLLSVMALG
jgi:hypothetical protein